MNSTSMDGPEDADFTINACNLRVMYNKKNGHVEILINSEVLGSYTPESAYGLIRYSGDYDKFVLWAPSFYGFDNEYADTFAMHFTFCAGIAIGASKRV